MAEMSILEKVARAIWRTREKQFPERVRRPEPDNFDNASGAWDMILDQARAAIEAMDVPEITEDSFYEIEEAAAKKMREWERGYVCQDIRIQHSMVWWVAKEVEARMRAALSEEVAG